MVEDNSIEVSAGDAVMIHIGERHYATSSPRSELEFLAISLPAYDAGDYFVEESA